MQKIDLKVDMIMIIIVSLVGFCFEDIWMLIRYNLLDNRNMYLPFLIGYGLLIVIMYHLIGTPDKIFNKYEFKKPMNYIIYILICFVIVSVEEIALGITIEHIYHFSYWNYTKIPLHITKYTSVLTSIGFSLAITLFMKYVYVPIENKVKNISKKIPILLVVLIITILSLDCLISFETMNINNGRNIVWMIKFK